MDNTTKTETKPEDTITLEAPAPKVEAPAKPTREEIVAAGVPEAEIVMMEKHGMVGKPVEKPAAEPVGEDKKPEPAPEDKKPEEKPKPTGSLPNFDMTPEQEKVFLAAFGPGTSPRAMYFRMKNERRARQAQEARTRELEARLTAMETSKPAAPEVDADGNAVDPEDKPLTLKALKELQKTEAEAIQKQQEANKERQDKLRAAYEEQEEFARANYADFDDTVNRAKEVIQNIEMLGQPWQKAKAVQLIRQLQVAAANADQMGLDDYTAAQIAYELGQMHPEHGKPTPKGTGTSKEDPKGDGAQAPGTLKRALDNTQRRKSSASVPEGGGKRTVSVEDVDLAALNAMPYAQRRAFKDKHPEQYDRLLRG